MKPLLQACSLSGTRASAFKKPRPYVSTGDVNGQTISPSAVVTFDDRPSRADLVAEDGDILFARMQATDKVVLVNSEKSTFIWSTGFAALRPQQGISSRWAGVLVEIVNVSREEKCFVYWCHAKGDN